MYLSQHNRSHKNDNNHFSPCKLSHIFIGWVFFVVVACLALCYPFDVYFYKCFEEKKWMHPTRRWILTGKSFHRSFAERFMNCRIEVFFLFFVSFSFHLTSSLAPSIQCDKYRKWNWWAQKKENDGSNSRSFYCKHFVVRFNFGFCFYPHGKYFAIMFRLIPYIHFYPI